MGREIIISRVVVKCTVYWQGDVVIPCPSVEYMYSIIIVLFIIYTLVLSYFDYYNMYCVLILVYVCMSVIK